MFIVLIPMEILIINVRNFKFFVFQLAFVIARLCVCAALPTNTLFRDHLVKNYFNLGYTVKEILGMLLFVHHIIISERTIKRILTRLQLRRRAEDTLENVVFGILRLHNHGYSELGYRSIWRLLNTKLRIRAHQDTVRYALSEMDPRGVALRQKRRLRRRRYANAGPNFLVHIDGYDKLKPFGISIHGAIDGFSRKILWLKASSSNKNPRYIAYYYLQFVKALKKVPRMVRADHGTENSNIRDIHIALRMYHSDCMAGVNSFSYGRSTGNQRIEMLWAILKKYFTSFWRNFFRDMIDENTFDNDDPLHVQCLLLCFLPVIQRHLDTFTHSWNNHRIRSQRNVECEYGKPNILYYQPLLYGCHDHAFNLSFDENSLLEIENRYSNAPSQFGCSEDMLRLARLTCGLDEGYFVRRRDPMESKRLFHFILSKIYGYL